MFTTWFLKALERTACAKHPLAGLPTGDIRSEHPIQNCAATSLSLKPHAVNFVPEKLQMLHITSCNDLNAFTDGTCEGGRPGPGSAVARKPLRYLLCHYRI
jgi:hypothetical protein